MSDFTELDRILGVEQQVGLAIPQQPTQRWIEDQWACNEALSEIYEKAGYERPKTVWASSPRVLHESLEMMRNIHVGQRHNFINAIIPYNEDALYREAQKTLLEALVERDLTVTLGMAMYGKLPYKKPYGVRRIDGFLRHSLQPKNLSGRTAPAGWGDACMYSEGMSSTVIADQSFCILAYLKLAWICSPVKEVVDYDNGQRWTWKDGYTVFLKNEEENKQEPLTLDGDSQPRMQAKNMKQLTEGTK